MPRPYATLTCHNHTLHPHATFHSGMLRQNETIRFDIVFTFLPINTTCRWIGQNFEFLDSFAPSNAADNRFALIRRFADYGSYRIGAHCFTDQFGSGVNSSIEVSVEREIERGCEFSLPLDGAARFTHTSVHVNVSCSEYANPIRVVIDYGDGVTRISAAYGRPYRMVSSYRYTAISPEGGAFAVRVSVCGRYACSNRTVSTSVYRTLDLVFTTAPAAGVDNAGVVISSRDGSRQSGLSVNVTYGDRTSYAYGNLSTPIRLLHRNAAISPFSLVVYRPDLIVDIVRFTGYFGEVVANISVNSFRRGDLVATLTTNSEVLVAPGQLVTVDALTYSVYQGNVISRREVTFEWWCYTGKQSNSIIHRDADTILSPTLNKGEIYYTK